MTVRGIKYNVNTDDAQIVNDIVSCVREVPAFSILMNWTCNSSTP
jgi:hypothetical protein